MFMSFFFSLILISALSYGSTAQTYPATVEIDLVFPRNETFAPSPVTPLVFAIQNPIATVALPYTIEWIIRKFGGGVFFGDTFIPKWANYSTDPNPYYVYTWTPFLNSTEGVFSFLWVIHSGNCSGTPGQYGTLGETDKNNYMVFTLKNGAQKQNLVPGPGTCPIAGNTFNVTGTLQVLNPIEFSFDTTCAVLAPEQPPANPCAVQVNDTVASSILSMVTYSACTTPIVPFGTAPPVLTSGCPAPSSTTSLAVRSNFGGGAVLGVAWGSLLSLVIFCLLSR